jgi:hypothetical protein
MLMVSLEMKLEVFDVAEEPKSGVPEANTPAVPNSESGKGLACYHKKATEF